MASIRGPCGFGRFSFLPQALAELRGENGLLEPPHTHTPVTLTSHSFSSLCDTVYSLLFLFCFSFLYPAMIASFLSEPILRFILHKTSPVVLRD